MNTVANIIRTIFEVMVWPVDYMPDWLGLTLISLISGVAMLWVFGKTTPQKALERAKDKMLAAVYEIRLYIDSPARVFAAQGRMIFWSIAYTALMLPAFVVLTLPLGWLYLHLETRYGLEPLPTNQAVVVQVAIDDTVDGRTVTAIGDDNVRVTAPPLYIADEGLVYLRVELDAAETSTLTVDVDGQTIEKSLDAATGADTYSPDRGGGLAALWVITAEDPIDVDGVQWISVVYPARDSTVFGLPMPWWVYWLVVATAAALALRKRMGVVL